MKKQDANNKLAFSKANVTELNDNQIIQVNGGSLSFIIKELLNTRIPVII